MSCEKRLLVFSDNVYCMHTASILTLFHFNKVLETPAKDNLFHVFGYMSILDKSLEVQFLRWIRWGIRRSSSYPCLKLSSECNFGEEFGHDFQMSIVCLKSFQNLFRDDLQINVWNHLWNSIPSFRNLLPFDQFSVIHFSNLKQAFSAQTEFHFCLWTTAFPLFLSSNSLVKQPFVK